MNVRLTNLRLIIITAIAAVIILFNPNADKALALGDPITMVGFGERIFATGVGDGDTWDSAWLANDDVYVQHNDGFGFGGTSFVHDRIGKLIGTPEEHSSLTGVDLNPGTLGNLFGSTYSTSIYEADGVLYHIVALFDQDDPNDYAFINSSLLKSVNGGATWTNHLGQTDVVPPTDSTSMFPNRDFGEISFVKYGKGGVAPAIDNAQNYVYLFANEWINGDHYYMARVLRTDLPLLDKTKFQYYKGGNLDGMLSSSWSTYANKGSILDLPFRTNPGSIVYNEGLGRYLMSTGNSNSFLVPPQQGSYRILEAPHPWGPWTYLLEENMENQAGDNMTWPYLMQKFMSPDGKKMWMTASGRSPYGLQFVPIYFSTATVTTSQAESAALTGLNTATAEAGYTGSGYVTGFNTVGDKAVFTITAPTSGAYILNLSYNTTANQQVSLYVNNIYKQKLLLGEGERYFANWSDISSFTWLAAGTNTITVKYDTGDSGNLNLDHLKFSLYSTEEGSLPGSFSPGSDGRQTLLDKEIPAANTTEPVRTELGTKFKPTVNGTVTKVKLYTSAAEVGGTHDVRIWRVSDSQIIAGPYSWNIASGAEGWREFDIPDIRLSANTDYIVSISTGTDKRFSYTVDRFTKEDRDRSLITYVGSGLSNSVLGNMPNTTFQNSSYFRDIVFIPEVSIVGPRVPITQGTDANVLELGTKFSPVTNGKITKVRLYTSSLEGGGNHNIRIWRLSDNTVIAGPYAWSIASGTQGWREFDIPDLEIEANKDYIVSISTGSDKRFSYSHNDFSPPSNNGYLVSYTGSGLFTATLGAIPNQTYERTNYFRDIVFEPSAMTNLAAGKTASSSSTSTGWAPAKAVDRDYYQDDSENAWATANNSDVNSWWKVDLGSAYTLNKVKVQYRGFGAPDKFRFVPLTITVQTSSDNVSWTTRFNRSTHVPVNGATYSPSLYEYELGAVSARYVRLLFEDGSTDTGVPGFDLVEIAEVEVLGN